MNSFPDYQSLNCTLQLADENYMFSFRLSEIAKVNFEEI